VAEIVWCINIFHLTWPMSPPYLVKVRCSKLLHKRWNVLFATNYLTTELAHSKLKYGLFSRIISCHDRSAQNCQTSCSKCAPRTRTQAPRRRRVSLASLSLQESDSVVFSMCWGAVLLKHKKLVLGQPVHVWQWPLSKKVVATLCLFSHWHQI